jgi:hypothetical protein
LDNPTVPSGSTAFIPDDPDGWWDDWIKNRK